MDLWKSAWDSILPADWQSIGNRPASDKPIYNRRQVINLPYIDRYRLCVLGSRQATECDGLPHCPVVPDARLSG